MTEVKTDSIPAGQDRFSIVMEAPKELTDWARPMITAVIESWIQFYSLFGQLPAFPVFQRTVTALNLLPSPNDAVQPEFLYSDGFSQRMNAIPNQALFDLLKGFQGEQATPQPASEGTDTPSQPVADGASPGTGEPAQPEPGTVPTENGGQSPA